MLCCQSRRWNRAEATSKTRARYWSPISFRAVVGPFEEARGLDLQLADLPHGVAVQPPEPGQPPRPPIGTDQAVGGLQAVVEAVVDVAEFQELDVGELDDLQRVGAIGVGDEPGCPVEDDQVVGRVGEAQPGGLADLTGARAGRIPGARARRSSRDGARASRLRRRRAGRRCIPRSSR